MKSSAPTRGWWGDGPAPWETWPGVSLEIAADWIPERDRWESPDGRFYFDDNLAERPSRFALAFLQPTMGEHAGKPMRFLPWQRELIVRPLFGWLRVDTGFRRFNQAYVEVAKKNGKSLFCSVLGPYLAFADGEPGAQVYVAAGDEEQAKIVWGESRSMVQGSDAMLEECEIEVLASSLYQAKTNSSFRALTAKAATKHGFNVHGLIFDELHAQKSRALWETLVRGVSARRQPVILVITTAGSDRESICYEEHERALGVLDGSRDEDYFLPVVFRLADGDDWTDPEVWHKVNPGLGTVKSLKYMHDQCAAAQNEPRKRNDFLRLELTVWTESRTVWITPEAWEACRREIDGDPPDLADLVCCVGLDLSETMDLTAMVAVFRRPDERPPVSIDVEDETDEQKLRTLTVDFSIEIKSWFWLPHDTLVSRSKKEGYPYDVWERDGWLRSTEGAIIDYRAIRNTILDEVVAKYNVGQVGFDPYNARQLAAVLIEDGVEMVEVRQGALSLNGACKLLEGLIAAGRVWHDGNPVLRWCFANAEVSTDVNGNIRPVKPGGEARGSRRIDGVVATVIALSRLMVAPEQQESGGVSFLTW